VFTDGRRERFDLVVAATGYHVSIPFLADGLLPSRNGVPQLVGGCCVPGQRDLYVFGCGQPRYGAGPLVSAGAEALCTIVQTQARLRDPVGDWLAWLGMGPPSTMLQDPHEVLRKIALGNRIIPRLPWLESWGRHPAPAARALPG
jgi:hypothetical protein